MRINITTVITKMFERTTMTIHLELTNDGCVINFYFLLIFHLLQFLNRQQRYYLFFSGQYEEVDKFLSFKLFRLTTLFLQILSKYIPHIYQILASPFFPEYQQKKDRHSHKLMKQASLEQRNKI